MSEVIEDLLSRDSHRIWKGAGAICVNRDESKLNEFSKYIDEIESATYGIDLGGALSPNSRFLEFAILKLKFVRDKKGCLCLLYPKHDSFDPRKEEKQGYIRILDTKMKEQWVDFYVCVCCVCGLKYTVSEEEYRMTWWGWAQVEEERAVSSQHETLTLKCKSILINWLSAIIK